MHLKYSGAVMLVIPANELNVSVKLIEQASQTEGQIVMQGDFHITLMSVAAMKPYRAGLCWKGKTIMLENPPPSFPINFTDSLNYVEEVDGKSSTFVLCDAETQQKLHEYVKELMFYFGVNENEAEREGCYHVSLSSKTGKTSDAFGPIWTL